MDNAGQQYPPPPPHPPQGFGPPPQPYAAPQQPQAPSPHPDFLAADRRQAIVIDADGVSFEHQGQTADFPWRHIQTVHFKAGPAGTVLMVAVVLPDGRFFEGTVSARNAATLHEWFAEIAPVLAYYLNSRGQ
ncbi:hypothetical protein [Streptomyces sp. NPDC050738]|uniref:hypothetical protein n=1 Tax=Streptomyces sp. NPDC050738 TaxID=3154744 RepID=UPI0034285239